MKKKVSCTNCGNKRTTKARHVGYSIVWLCDKCFKKRQQKNIKRPTLDKI